MLILKNILSHKSLNLLICALFSTFIAVSCIDDDILLEDPSNPDSSELEGDVIGFTMELDKSLTTRTDLLNTRGIEDKDDWIDMQDKFRVFFFTDNGDFLFGANDRIVGSLTNLPGTTGTDYWYVRIPMTMIVDRNNQEYDMAKIKRYLKTHGFKIAVLANWPNAGDKVNPGDYDDSAENNFKDNPSSTLKGEPLWSWENSVLNEKAIDIKNINDLHHIYNDLFINEDPGGIGREKRKNVFEPFMNLYQDNNGTNYDGFGQPTDWVKMRSINEGWAPKGQVDGVGAVPIESFDSKSTANQWIRAYWNPDLNLNEEKKIYRHYQHLWFLWNFNAIYNIGNFFFDKIDPSLEDDEVVDDEATKAAAKQYYGGNFQWNDGRTIGNTTNKWGYEWWQRNGRELYTKWIKGNENTLKDYSLRKGSANNSAYLEFKAPSASSGKVAQLATIRIEGTDRYGIKLPQLVNGQGTGDQMTVTTESSGYFKFQARTSGSLRIRWGSIDETNASIVVQREKVRDRKYTIEAGNKNQWFDIKEPGTNDNFRDISITSESEDIYIFCQEGNAVIYGIEFIRGEYLYLTDREGVTPNEHQGIPMYGVQSYPPMSDWVVGTTINLTTNVSLIRALAKVEVYIPTKYGDTPPAHVYMRCMNRTAHCEPMDVETDTSELWDDTHDKTHCEWFNIQKYAPAFNASSDKESYQNHLSWFYGSWKYASWFAHSEDKNSTDDQLLQGRYYDKDHGHYRSSQPYTGWSFKGKSFEALNSDGNLGDMSYNHPVEITEGNDKTEQNCYYPRLFNPHINRSEFCSFLYVGVDGNFYKYVLYVPDKFINDPIYPGDLSSTPKVPHIEFRFKAQDTPSGAESEVDAIYNNSEFNLDDNDCFRVYFTNYGYDDKGGTNNSLFGLPANTNIRTQGKENYDTYEANIENLKYHWPIMRNHVYQFYLSESGPTTPHIRVKVTDWSHEKIVLDW